MFYYLVHATCHEIGNGNFKCTLAVLGTQVFHDFQQFWFSHGQISKFWNKKELLPSIWNYRLHLAEVRKRQILIKFWSGMIYGKIYDYFPMPNYS